MLLLRTWGTIGNIHMYRVTSLTLDIRLAYAQYSTEETKPPKPKQHRGGDNPHTQKHHSFTTSNQGFPVEEVELPCETTY